MLPRLQRAFALTFRQQRMPVQFTVSTNFTTLEKIFLESSERLKKKKNKLEKFLITQVAGLELIS